jgi:hypothetical protein
MVQTMHEGLANAATLFTLILALWGFVRYARGLGVDGSYLGAVVVGEFLIVVDALLGILLYAGGGRPERAGIHILYGIVAVISFPAFFAYTRGRDSRLEMLLWALLALFVWGVTIRARIVAL